MFGNLGFGEIVALALIGFFLFGPERLPQIAADTVKVLRQLREMARGATAELKAELGTDQFDTSALDDLRELRDLHPRNFARSILSDDPPPPPRPAAMVGAAAGTLAAATPAGPSTTRPVVTAVIADPLGEGELPPFDPDAT